MTTTPEQKRFSSLQAQFALHGHALRRSGPNEGSGAVSYLCERWGLVRELPTLNDAQRFLEWIGGAA